MSSFDARPIAVLVKVVTAPAWGPVVLLIRLALRRRKAARQERRERDRDERIARRYLPEPFATEWNALFRAEVQARGPAACLVDLRELGGPPPLPASVRFLKEYLESDYVFIRRVGEDGLFRRKATGETQRPATARSAAERP